MKLQTKISYGNLITLIEFVEHQDYELDDEFKTIFSLCQSELAERLRQKLKKSIDKIVQNGIKKELSLSLTKIEAIIILKCCSIIEFHELNLYCLELRKQFDNLIFKEKNSQRIKEKLQLEQKNQLFLE